MQAPEQAEVRPEVDGSGLVCAVPGSFVTQLSGAIAPIAGYEGEIRAPPSQEDGADRRAARGERGDRFALGEVLRMRKYEAPELQRNENLKELTKVNSVVSPPVNGSLPSWPSWPSG